MAKIISNTYTTTQSLTNSLTDNPATVTSSGVSGSEVQRTFAAIGAMPVDASAIPLVTRARAR
jgi:hypothetical protein